MDRGELTALRRELESALTGFDGARAHEQLDRLFGVYSADTALTEVVLPSLRHLGERGACGEVGVGHEHFASNLIHGRLLSLARKWDAGHGPRALLATPPGELHTIGLLSFGLALWTRGWRITYLGADTPVGAVAPARDHQHLRAIAVGLPHLKVDEPVHEMRPRPERGDQVRRTVPP